MPITIHTAVQATTTIVSTDTKVRDGGVVITGGIYPAARRVGRVSGGRASASAIASTAPAALPHRLAAEPLQRGDPTGDENDAVRARVGGAAREQRHRGLQHRRRGSRRPSRSGGHLTAAACHKRALS
jgi:hypothetical protein